MDRLKPPASRGVKETSLVEDDMKTFTTLGLVLTLVLLTVGSYSPAASANCTAQERIQLGNQGYDKDEVQRACSDGGDDFWDSFTRELGSGLANGLTKGLNQTLGIRDNNQASTQSGDSASICVTNAGTCPLAGGPQGYPCYCRAWNGATFSGFSR
jgi:hypothetical protein